MNPYLQGWVYECRFWSKSCGDLSGIKFIAFVVGILLLSLLMSGCSKPTEETLMGKWQVVEVLGTRPDLLIIRFGISNSAFICDGNQDRRNCNSARYEISDGGLFDVKITFWQGGQKEEMFAHHNVDGDLILAIDDDSFFGSINTRWERQ